MYFGMMDGSGFMGGWVGMAFGGIMMILWFALIIALIILVVRWIGGGAPRRDSDQDCLDILKQRYARGEIDAAELAERSLRLKTGK